MTRFDVDTLRRMAGDTVFARGQNYYRDGQVEILRYEPGRVVARVTGTAEYRVVLTGNGSEIDGECSCPAFEDWGFCKHLVAVALTANETVDDDGTGPLERIRSHLQGKDLDALVAMILDLAERDDSLYRRLEMDAAAASDEDDILDARFRKAIDAATATGGFVHYREAAGWAEEVDAVLDRLSALVGEGRAALALGLIDHALFRIEDAINEIDDSAGHCGALLERAHDIHLEACRIARPDPVALAGELYTREVEGGWDTFHNSAALYADILGQAGLAELHRLASAAWDKIPPLPGGRRAQDDFS